MSSTRGRSKTNIYTDNVIAILTVRDCFTVAGYRRRHVLVDDVPGLYIRRLTLEDPRLSRDRIERPDSRSPSPVRHICHPRSAESRPGRGSSSSYRFWLERVKNEKPAQLTITSLELPECPIPLIDSQASARWRGLESPRVNSEKDEILDEFLESVSKAGKNRMKIKSADRRISKAIQRSRKHFGDGDECQGNAPSLETCTKNIVNGPSRALSKKSHETTKDCICSEITENLRINIREKTEVKQTSPRSQSPEVTHTIRIAMKYLGQRESQLENVDDNEIKLIDNNSVDTKINNEAKDNADCGVNVALDFTLNCCSVQLTSRDITLKSAGKNRTE